MSKRLWQNLFLITIFTLLLPTTINAKPHHGNDHLQIFHAFTFEAEDGEGQEGNTHGWDLDGWIGGDFNRLWLKSEKKDSKNYESKSEVQALYGLNFSDFWDAQIGIRHDFKTDFSDHSLDYFTIGLEGLAPYFFETDAHLFVSQDGNTSARLKQEFDFFLTQKLITQPYLEADFFAQNVVKLEVRRGLSELEIGTITRYEITKKFAPYVALRYNTKIGGTKEYAQKIGEKLDNFIIAVGIRLRF